MSNTFREEIKHKNVESEFNSSWEEASKGTVDATPNAFKGGWHCQAETLVNYEVQGSV